MPHDVRDRDVTEPNVLVDTVYKGKPSKLLLHADRNGFFYVLDRMDGKLLLAKPLLPPLRGGRRRGGSLGRWQT
jgi:glucose dehydrogenase